MLIFDLLIFNNLRLCFFPLKIFFKKIYVLNNKKTGVFFFKILNNNTRNGQSQSTKIKKKCKRSFILSNWHVNVFVWYETCFICSFFLSLQT